MTTTAQNEMDVISNIVAAYAARADATPDQITKLYADLRGTAAPSLGEQSAQGTEIPSAEPKAKPAVAIENSIEKNAIACLCCGKKFKMLKRHLGAEHGLTIPEYRNQFGLPDDYPMVAPAYSKMKAGQAKRSQFGKYDRTTAKAAPTEAAPTEAPKTTKARSTKAKGRSKAKAES